LDPDLAEDQASSDDENAIRDENHLTVPSESPNNNTKYSKLTVSNVSKLASQESYTSSPNSKGSRMRRKKSSSNGRPINEEFIWGQREDAPGKTETIASFKSHRTARSEKSVVSMDRRTIVEDVWGQFFATILSIKYWPWIIAFAANVLRGTYFGNSAADQLGKASDFFVIMSPLSFIPCLPFGLLADKYSCFPVIFVINSCGLISTLILSFSQDVPSNYIAVMFFWFLQSFSTSQNYVFNAQLFPPFLMGRLTGLTMLVAGLVGFLASPLYSFGADKGFKLSDWIATGLGIATLTLAILLFFLHPDTLRKNKLIINPTSPKEQNAININPSISDLQMNKDVPSFDRRDSKAELDDYVRAHQDAYHHVAQGEQGQAALAMIWAPSVRDTSKLGL